MLIELLIAASLAGIIISAQGLMLYKYIKIHQTETSKSRESFYVNEAFMIIEQQIKSAKCVSAKDNIIILKSYEKDKEHKEDKVIYDKPKYNYIKQNGHSSLDIVITDSLVNSSYNNKILKDIKKFKVEQDNQLLYISIETKKGIVYKRCLGVERVEIKDIL